MLFNLAYVSVCVVSVCVFILGLGGSANQHSSAQTPAPQEFQVIIKDPTPHYGVFFSGSFERREKNVYGGNVPRIFRIPGKLKKGPVVEKGLMMCRYIVW